MENRPLEGIRILEIGGYISMPLGTSLLCSLGAEVVKVEKPIVGEDFRRRMNEMSPYFRQYNYGKRSLAVDLKSAEGVELVKSLVSRFDVVVENLRPGKIEAIGLGYDICRSLRPDVIYGSITGFGRTGPLAGRPAYDTIGQAFGGVYSILGDKGHPQLAGGLNADLITGLVAGAGLLAAIVGRERSGQGQRLETSIAEAVSVLITDSITQSFEYGSDPTRTSRHPQAQNFCVPTSDGRFIAIHLSSSEKFWQALCTAMQRADLAADPRFCEYRSREANYFELAPLVERQFATNTFEYWEHVLVEYDVPFTSVQSISEYLRCEQVDHLQMIDWQDDGMPLVRAPWTLGGARPERRGRAPRVGADSRAIAAEVRSLEEIQSLIDSGVLFVDG